MGAVFINAFWVPPEREDEFLRLWQSADVLLRREGCYLSTRLHRARSAEATFSFVRVAELASVERWRAVLATADFQAIAAQMAQFRSVPAVYEVVRHHVQPDPSVETGTHATPEQVDS